MPDSTLSNLHHERTAARRGNEHQTLHSTAGISPFPTLPDDPTLILLMIVGAALYGWWTSARAAAERAATLGRDACQAAGVIWLDQSVHANGLKLRRGEDGRLGLERSFRFEY